MNWNLLGHDWAVDLLRTHIARGEVRHAYLITGPQGVGRRTLALQLAQALNCAAPPAPGEACGKCPVCRGMAVMQHPDLTVIQTQPDKTQILVDQVRELQHTLALHSYAARHRFALLLRFEEASIAAQNALLKTLEEPPPQVVLVLTAESAELLLPTIVSRCETLRLRPLPLDHLCQGLQSGWNVATEQAQRAGHISGGRPGAAIRMLQDPQELDAHHALLADSLRVVRLGRVERFAFAEALARDKEAMRRTLLAWQSLWRDVLLRAAGSATPLCNLDFEVEIDLIARRLGPQGPRQVLLAIERTQELLKSNANARLAAEVLMLDMPTIS